MIRALMLEILGDAGYAVSGAGTAEEALATLDGGTAVDVVVSDIVMPGLTGIELLERVRRTRPSLPVVMVTGAGTYTYLTEALAGGANGLVVKPFSHADLKDAVATALERSRRAERELRERLLTPTLAGALANAIEARETSLHGHCERLAALAVNLALAIGMAPDEVEVVRLGALLHDVGKIGIPDRILMKAGPFTPEEQAIMRTHPLIGERILEPLESLAAVRRVVRHHHERWDGAGYPAGLAGDEIPRAARVVAVADAVEAMSAPRPYRQPLVRREIVAELEAGRGRQWDPEVVDAMLALIEAGRLRFGLDGFEVVGAEDVSVEAAATYAVLLVEDDPDHALLAKEALESSLPEVAVSHAPDIATASQLCRGSVWSLVVLDNRLPDGNGLELLESLRRESPRVPVLMLTGEGSESVAVEAFRHGASDYVVKRNGYLGELTGRVRMLLEAA